METLSLKHKAGICRLLFLTIIAVVLAFAANAFGIEVTITLANNKVQKATLEKMGDDGSLTLKIEGGTTQLKRDQYIKVVSTETPPEIAAAEQLYNEKKYAEALKNYQSAYDKYKWLNWGETALQKIGDCYRGQGENEKALESYEKFLKQYPRAGSTYKVKYGMALCYRAVGKKTDSIEAFTVVADATDDLFTVYALSNIGDIQFEQGEYEKALRSYLRMIVLYENTAGTDAKVKEAKVNIGKCYDKLIEKTTSQTEREKLQTEKERAVK
jgi:tetratricopeptide (TPR) repeat protein